ncbi:hypothetical protein [Clostridium chrysemydis]|uniref:hypothetical protein n=1 Tax=Clostridium chrysemydis TaxID=2665504 RepID=UPI0018839669
MSDYQMDIKGDINSIEYSNIYEYLSIIDTNDKFTITFRENNNSSVKIINSMLEDNNFYIEDCGIRENGEYYIKARR